MRKTRTFVATLSRILTRLRVRDASAFETPRLSVSGKEPVQQQTALIETPEDLLWTCR